MPQSLDQKPGCLGFLQKLLAGLVIGESERDGPWPYAKKKYLLSRAEFSFFRVLQQACGERFVVCPKVRLADLMYVKKGTENRQSFHNKIDRKHIDFVLCDAQTMQPVAAVELDDQSHNNEKARQRDEVKDKACAAAGLPLIRFKVQRAYDPNAIATQLAELDV